MLTGQRLCRIYNKRRLEMCRTFPIDQRDIDEVALFGGTCGYRFEKHPLPYAPHQLSRNEWENSQNDLPVTSSGDLITP